MKYLVIGMGDERGHGKTIVEEAPVAVKGSNGVVERAVQEIEEHVRAILLRLIVWVLGLVPRKV
eukprot:7293901-Karenia_brevis.AAC.1